MHFFAECGAVCCEKMPKAFAAGRGVFGVRLNDLLAAQRIFEILDSWISENWPFDMQNMRINVLPVSGVLSYNLMGDKKCLDYFEAFVVDYRSQ